MSVAFADRICLGLRLTLVPFGIRQVIQRRRVTILVYHRPRPETFARHVRVLRKLYNLISLDAFVTALERGTLRHLPPKSLVLTLDDGHRSNYELINTFRGLPAPPTIFICSGIVDSEQAFWFDVVADPEELKRVPDEERVRRLDAMAAAGATGARAALDGHQITELKPYVDFQSHTVTHPILPRCDDDKALRELADSRLDLQRRYGLRVYAVAYPNGDWSQRDLRFARQTGYRCGLTVRSGFNGPRTDPFRMRRIAVNDDVDGVHVVVLKACGVWGALRSVFRRRRGRGSPQERV